MSTEVLWAPVHYRKYSAEETLPSRFERLIDRMEMGPFVSGKWTVIKMHMGRQIGFTTIHPLFVKILVDKLRSYGAKVFIADQDISGARSRGYSEDYLGVPLIFACGVTGKYFVEKTVDFKTFHHLDIGGNIHDAEVMINLSHAKGHGACGFAGACKNIAMGCVTDRTRGEIHNLEGGLLWDEELCDHCEACLQSCNHHANQFDSAGRYQVFFHHCTYCQHCIKVCPKGAITLDASRFEDFQTGMAICTDEVLKTFQPGSVFYINFLLNVTALCDCWGFSTPPMIPDIGIMASRDLVAVERASLDSIRVENLIPAGIPQGFELTGQGHLFEQLHGKNPLVQLNQLEAHGLGRQAYSLSEIL
jgi:uncharacterized Fe-S center protein